MLAIPMVTPMNVVAAERELVTMRTGEIWEFRNITDRTQTVRIYGNEGTFGDRYVYPRPVSGNFGSARGASIGWIDRGHGRITTGQNLSVPRNGMLLIELRVGASVRAIGDENALQIRQLITPVLDVRTISEGVTLEFLNSGANSHPINWTWHGYPRSTVGVGERGLIHHTVRADGTSTTPRNSGAGSGVHVQPGNTEVLLGNRLNMPREVWGSFTAFSGQPYRLTIDGQRSFPPGMEQDLPPVVQPDANAATPLITGPDDRLVPIGSTLIINVLASVPRGTLTYQWYSTPTPENTGGTPIPGATDSFFMPPELAVPMYYYVVVTNTDTAVTGNQTASATSRAARVVFHQPPPPDPFGLAELFSQNSSVYNHELATFAAELSALSYDRTALHDRFREIRMENIQPGNLTMWPFNNTDFLSFDIASRQIELETGVHDLVFVVIRGTPTWPPRDFNLVQWIDNSIPSSGSNDLAHGGFRAGQENVLIYLNNYLRNNNIASPATPAGNRTILLLTGHSRGGAVANLLADGLVNTPSAHRNNIYTYTFGTPNVTSSPATGSHGIFNIINRNDIVPLLPRSLPPNRWGRYGTDMPVTMPTVSSTIVPGPGLTGHGSSIYHSWMVSNPSLTYNQFRVLDRRLLPRILTFKCPVDIVVYDNNNNIVARIENNIPINFDGSQVYAFVLNDTKHIFIPYGNTYSVRITATGVGTMTYTIETLDVLSGTPTATKTFENVQLYSGRQMVSEIVANTSNVQLLLEENSVVVGDIATNGTITRRTQGGGTGGATGGGEFTGSGLPPTQPQSTIQPQQPASDVVTPPATSPWAVGYVSAAIAAGLVPQHLQSNYTQATTRAEFTALAVALYETTTGRTIRGRTTFNDTVDLNVQRAGYLGIVNGVGNGNFNPNGQLTREQAAVMLARLANVIGQPLPQSAPTFADNAQISSWAFDAVGQAQAVGIMGGVGDNRFAPSGDYTREQSIVTILRLFELLN